MPGCDHVVTSSCTHTIRLYTLSVYVIMHKIVSMLPDPAESLVCLWRSRRHDPLVVIAPRVEEAVPYPCLPPSRPARLHSRRGLSPLGRLLLVVFFALVVPLRPSLEQRSRRVVRQRDRPRKQHAWGQCISRRLRYVRRGRLRLCAARHVAKTVWRA